MPLRTKDFSHAIDLLALAFLSKSLKIVKSAGNKIVSDTITTCDQNVLVYVYLRDDNIIFYSNAV